MNALLVNKGYGKTGGGGVARAIEDLLQVENGESCPLEPEIMRKNNEKGMMMFLSKENNSDEKFNSFVLLI